MSNKSLLPGIIALIVILLLSTGILALGRFLPKPLMWGIIAMPIWSVILIIAILYSERSAEKNMQRARSTRGTYAQGKDKISIKKRGRLYSLYLKIKKKIKKYFSGENT